MALRTDEERALEGVEVVTLGQLARAGLRRWKVVASAVLLACLGAALLWLLTPSAYSATASVDVTPDPASNIPLSAVTGVTERDVVLSRSVADRAAQTLRPGQPGISAQQIRSRLSVAAPRQSRVLTISYEARSAAAAAAGANAVAEAYLSFRADQSRQRLVVREADIRTHLNRALAQINDLPLSQGVQRQFAQGEVSRLRGQLNYVEGTAVDTGRIVDHAEVPSAAGGPPARAFLVGAVLVGLLLGVPAAVIVDFRRSRPQP